MKLLNTYISSNTHPPRLLTPLFVMKRALPVYDDLDALEDGEIEGDFKDSSSTLDLSSTDSDAGEDGISLRPILPFGKFTKDFRDGDVPGTGEEYLCLVRHQRKKLPGILNSRRNDYKAVEVVNLLKGFSSSSCNGEPLIKDLDKTWADQYWENYLKCKGRYEESLLDISDDLEDVDLFEFNRESWFEKLYGAKDLNHRFHPSVNNLAVLKDHPEFVLKLISFHKHWMASDSFKSCDDENVSRLFTWLHALLMLLNDRLTAPEISVLREFLKVLVGHFPLNNHHSKDINEVALVITRVFKQHDLISYRE